MPSSRHRSSLAIIALVTFLGGPAGFASAAAARAGPPAVATPWLAISDVHYGPAIGGPKPSLYGQDTNRALLDSMLAEAHRVDPNAPVVFLAGDFLAHHFRNDQAAATMADLAKRFDAAFPRAQFVITLGNNDSACGDYSAPIGGPFLAAVARAWAPLVDRNGAAPHFAKTFAYDGSYTTTLPRSGLRAVVVNDIPFALRYDGSCSADVNAAALALTEVGAALEHAPPHSHAWLLLHVPPGIDAYTTSTLAHRLAVIPFTKPHARESLEAIVDDPRNRVSLVIAGHTHKFAYRVFPGRNPVPVLLVPSVSPIFGNAPSFLELGVDERGTVDDVEEHSYVDGGWQTIGDMASLGVRTFDGTQLLALQKRLARSPALRATFDRLYGGGAPPEIGPSNWRAYWCAATEFSASGYQRCVPEDGYSVLAPRALHLLAYAAIGVAAVLVLVVLALRRRKPLPG